MRFGSNMGENPRKIDGKWMEIRDLFACAGGVAFGCNLFMHCDAAWQGSDEECQRLAEKALVPTGGASHAPIGPLEIPVRTL